MHSDSSGSLTVTATIPSDFLLVSSCFMVWSEVLCSLLFLVFTVSPLAPEVCSKGSLVASWLSSAFSSVGTMTVSQFSSPSDFGSQQSSALSTSSPLWSKDSSTSLFSAFAVSLVSLEDCFKETLMASCLTSAFSFVGTTPVSWSSSPRHFFSLQSSAFSASLEAFKRSSSHVLSSTSWLLSDVTLSVESRHPSPPSSFWTFSPVATCPRSSLNSKSLPSSELSSFLWL